MNALEMKIPLGEIYLTLLLLVIIAAGIVISHVLLLAWYIGSRKVSLVRPLFLTGMFAMLVGLTLLLLDEGSLLIAGAGISVISLIGMLASWLLKPALKS